MREHEFESTGVSRGPCVQMRKHRDDKLGEERNERPEKVIATRAPWTSISISRYCQHTMGIAFDPVHRHQSSRSAARFSHKPYPIKLTGGVLSICRSQQKTSSFRRRCINVYLKLQTGMVGLHRWTRGLEKCRENHQKHAYANYSKQPV